MTHRETAAAFLCAVALSLPFCISYHPFPYPTGIQEALAGGAVSLTLVLLLPLRIRPAPVVWYALVFAAYVTLTTALLPDLSYVNRGYLFSLYVLLFAASVLVGQHLSIRGLCWLALAVILGALINVTKLPVGLLSQKNQFGTYLTLALVSLLYLRETNKITASLFIACSVILLYAANASGSRGVLLYLVVLLCYRRNIRTAFWLAAFMFMPSSLLGKALSTNAVTEVSRLVMLQEAYAEWTQSLTSYVFGIGAGQLFIPMPQYKQIADHCHSIFMQLLAETGVVGTALACAGVFGWMINFLKRGESAEWWWVFSVFTVLGMHSVWEYPLWYAFFLVPFGLVIGIGAQLEYTKSNTAV